MLTPQQIQEISFEKALFGGYDMESVDEILEPLTEDYVTLYKENSVLKSKMRILVEKLEEYRKQEASMQNAILAAQKTCEQMRLDSERRCAQMLREAEQAAAEKQRSASNQSTVEEERLSTARAATAQFLDGMEKRLKRQLELIDELRRQELPETPAPEQMHRFEAPRESYAEPTAQQPAQEPQPVREPQRQPAFDFDAEAAKHPSAEERADALIEEIGQQIEASLSASAVETPAGPEEPTRKLDDLHGVFSPQKQKIFDELQFGSRKNK